MGMVKIAKETNTLMIIPNAGLDAATGALCAPNIFRTSFSNWQPSYPMGKVLADRGIRNVVSLAWKYGAGEEAVAGFTEGFIKAGGKTVRGLWIPFPNAEFQALLTEIASVKPDAVFVFFAGAGAAKFVKDYAGWTRNKIPLLAPDFTDASDGSKIREGLETTLHYADGLGSKRDKEFRAAYAKAYTIEPMFTRCGVRCGCCSGRSRRRQRRHRKRKTIAAMEKADRQPARRLTMSVRITRRRYLSPQSGL
jgi:branched-chain amino acid transport system substrate-binding protein